MIYSRDDSPRWTRRSWPWALAWVPCVSFLFCAFLSGCAALTNPVANGLPVRRMSPEMLAPPRDDEKPIPLNLLGQEPPKVYRLEPGDVLGVWVEGILGERNQVPPVLAVADRAKPPGMLTPGVGYPVPVIENGTISLPQLEPIAVKGLSLAEVEEAIRQAYTSRKIIQPGRARVLVTLVRSRLYRIVVMRQDSNQINFGTGLIGSSNRGSGHVIDLPAYENDVLNALALTGGLPGFNAYNEVIIHRSRKACLPAPDVKASANKKAPATLASHIENALGTGAPSEPLRAGGMRARAKGEAPSSTELVLASAGCGPPPALATDDQIVRIPLSFLPGEEPCIKPEDVILFNGDVVYIESREREVFYTGGLLPSGEYPLPRDYSLDIVMAIARVRGPMLNGGFGANNLSGAIVAGGLGGPNPSLVTVLRKTHNGGQLTIRVDLNRALRDPRERILVQPGDILLLQETPGEATARYLTQTITIATQFLRQNDAAGTYIQQNPPNTNTILPAP